MAKSIFLLLTSEDREKPRAGNDIISGQLKTLILSDGWFIVEQLHELLRALNKRKLSERLELRTNRKKE